jgi:hypothetical protein
VPLQITHRQKRLAFEQVQLVHADEALELSGAIEGEQFQDLHLRASQMDVTYLRRVLGLPDAVAGRATLEAQLEGTFEELILRSELNLQEGSSQQLPFERLQATHASSSIDFPLNCPTNCRRWYKASCRWTAAYRRRRWRPACNTPGRKSSPNYSMAVRVEGLDMATVLPEGQGQLNARLRIQGVGFTTEQRRADLDLTVDTSGFTLAPGLTARLQASLTGEAIRLESFRLRSTPVDVVASGTLSAPQRATLTYAVTLGDLSALESQLGVALQASGTLSGRVEGPLDALQTQGRLQITDWRYAALHGRRLRAEFAAAQLPAAPQASLQAHLVGVQGPSLPPSTLRLEANYSSPRGSFTATVTQGPYENTMLAGSALLRDGLRLTLRRLHLQRGDLVWQNAAPIEVVRSPQGGLQLQRLALRSGTQEISAQGRLSPEGAVQAEVHVRGL